MRVPRLRTRLLGGLLAALLYTGAGAAEFNGLAYSLPAGWTALEQDLRLLLAPPGNADVDLLIVVLSAPHALGAASFRKWFDERMAVDLHPQARVLNQGEVQRLASGGSEMLTAARVVHDAAGEQRVQLFNAVSDGRQAAMAMALAANEQSIGRHAPALRAFFESMRFEPQTSAGSAQDGAATSAAPSPRTAPPTASSAPLPAGQYHCITTRWSPDQPLILEPSALGRLILDGRGTYEVSASGGSGRYRAGGGVAFESGPLAGWPALVETVEGRPRIRLGKSRETPPNPAGAAFGEHRCTWRN